MTEAPQYTTPSRRAVTSEVSQKTKGGGHYEEAVYDEIQEDKQRCSVEVNSAYNAFTKK